MLPGLIVTLVAFCWRHARGVVTLSLLLTLALGFYAATHIALDTDESHLIAADLPFRQQERKMDAAFPQDVDLLVAVIDGPSSEEAERAVNQLVDRLAGQSDLFRSLRRPPEDLFFRRHGLLFLSIDELTDLSDRLVAAQPLLGSLARDPSLRGLLGSVNLALEAAAHGQMDLKELKPLLDKLDKVALAAIGQGPIAAMSWASLFGPMAEHDAPTRVLLAQPVLQFGELVAGRQASDAIRQAAVELGLTKENGFRLRLTGPVALTDANFATVTEGMSLTGPLMLLAICLLLFLAVRSLRITLAILFSLIVGLVATAAFAAATIGSLNPISIAFAVMFVGIAVDFAIQFIVRYRDERLRFEDGRVAMHSAAKAMAAPLSLAALATAVGFLSFLPTDYTGVSQLGLIAGGGMIIALVVDFTLLPATIALIQPRPEKESYGLPLAAFDRWLTAHAGKVLIAASGLALAGAAALPWLPLDFNPLHLQNPKSEAVATFLDLARDPDNGSYGVQLLVPSRDAAQGLLAQFDRMPEVSRTMWLGSLIPDQQEDKRAILDDLNHLLGPALHPSEHLAAPSPDQLRAVLIQTADRLGPLDQMQGAADHLRALALAPPDIIRTFQQAVVAGLPGQIETLAEMIRPAEITEASLPAELRQAWVSSDGQFKAQILPSGNMQDQKELTAFVTTVRGKAPNATGMPISIEESGHVVVQAFARAALFALLAIGLLLMIMLRRLRDAVLVLLPLVMGALYTVIGCVISGLAINFANIIALPLLLGIGVAFNIYFVVNWRNGMTEHLASPTTRAVLFSALTTGAAFGSLAVSPHVGTASMGFLLFLSLALSVATTLIVLPAFFALLNRSKGTEASR